jgi:hypothetical protein
MKRVPAASRECAYIIDGSIAERAREEEEEEEGELLS